MKFCGRISLVDGEHHRRFAPFPPPPTPKCTQRYRDSDIFRPCVELTSGSPKTALYMLQMCRSTAYYLARVLRSTLIVLWFLCLSLCPFVIAKYQPIYFCTCIALAARSRFCWKTFRTVASARWRTRASRCIRSNLILLKRASFTIVLKCCFSVTERKIGRWVGWQ